MIRLHQEMLVDIGRFATPDHAKCFGIESGAQFYSALSIIFRLMLVTLPLELLAEGWMIIEARKSIYLTAPFRIWQIFVPINLSSFCLTSKFLIYTCRIMPLADIKDDKIEDRPVNLERVLSPRKWQSTGHIEPDLLLLQIGESKKGYDECPH